MVYNNHMLREIHEIGMYKGYLNRIQTLDPSNEESIEEVVTNMYQSRKLDQISKEMHDYLCMLLAERTVDLL